MHDGNESTENPGVMVRKRRKGIYILPNLFTLAALFGGFYSIVMAMNGRFDQAAVGVFCAMVLDSLDGRVARMTNTQSAFGEQMDSLSDMVSFGAAPALIAYEWSLQGLGRWGWIAAFVYCACAALRLARFNVNTAVVSHVEKICTCCPLAERFHPTIEVDDKGVIAIGVAQELLIVLGVCSFCEFPYCSHIIQAIIIRRSSCFWCAVVEVPQIKVGVGVCEFKRPMSHETL